MLPSFLICSTDADAGCKNHRANGAITRKAVRTFVYTLVLSSTACVGALAHAQGPTRALVASPSGISVEPKATGGPSQTEPAVKDRVRQLIELTVNSHDAHKLMLTRSQIREVLYRRNHSEQLFLITRSGTLYSFYVIDSKPSWQWRNKLVSPRVPTDWPPAGALECYLARQNKQEAAESEVSWEFSPVLQDTENRALLTAFKVRADGSLPVQAPPLEPSLEQAAFIARARKLLDLTLRSNDGHELKLKRSAIRWILYRPGNQEKWYLVTNRDVLYAFWMTDTKPKWVWKGTLLSFKRPHHWLGAGPLEHFLEAQNKVIPNTVLGPKGSMFVPVLNDAEDRNPVAAYSVLANGILAMLPATKLNRLEPAR